MVDDDGENIVRSTSVGDGKLRSVESRPAVVILIDCSHVGSKSFYVRSTNDELF